jgi:hypothetical protein
MMPPFSGLRYAQKADNAAMRNEIVHEPPMI